jgi:hypothetical protein
MKVINFEQVKKVCPVKYWANDGEKCTNQLGRKGPCSEEHCTFMDNCTESFSIADIDKEIASFKSENCSYCGAITSDCNECLTVKHLNNLKTQEPPCQKN